MRGGHRPAWSTTAAAALMATVTGAFAAYAVVALRGVGPERGLGSRGATSLGLTGQQETTVTVIFSLVILVVAALTLSQAIGVARRRQGARHAALMTFGVLGLLSLAAAVPGLQAVPPRPNAWYGVLVGLVDVAVVVLLMLPATADDVELAERERERRPARR